MNTIRTPHGLAVRVVSKYDDEGNLREVMLLLLEDE